MVCMGKTENDYQVDSDDIPPSNIWSFQKKKNKSSYLSLTWGTQVILFDGEFLANNNDLGCIIINLSSQNFKLTILPICVWY